MECGLNIEISIPVSAMKHLSHLAVVLIATGTCYLIKDKKSLVLEVRLNLSVCLKCCHRAYGTISCKTCKEEICFDNLLCLARWAGWKTILLDLKGLICKSSLDRSAEHDDLVRANSITVFFVSYLKLRFLLAPRCLIYCITTLTSQKEEHLGKVKCPLRNCILYRSLQSLS